MDELLARGHYARKQLFSRSRLVAWSHGSRFATARRLVAPHAGRRLLDYGCGDGTFLALVHDLFPVATGVDADADQMAECAARFAALPGLTFASTEALDTADPANRYDVVVCMEVLEHCPDDLQSGVLDQLHRVSAADAALVVSVPIEIGLSLAAKQLARGVAAWRGLSEYEDRERYRVSEFVRMLCARAETSIPRVETTAEFRDGHTLRYTGHKGFNWRTLENRIRERFTLERRVCSPMPLAGPWLNSQVWFVGRKKQET